MGDGQHGMKGESNFETYKLPYVKQIASGNLLYDTWSSKLVLCDSLESWEGGDIYISMADS